MTTRVSNNNGSIYGRAEKEAMIQGALQVFEDALNSKQVVRGACIN